MTIFVVMDPKIKEKWRKIAIENRHKFYNRKKLPEPAFIHQIMIGWAAQEVVGNWLKEKMPWPVNVNLKIGKNKYDTDHARGLCDVELNGRKADIKTSKALTHGFTNDEIIILAEYHYEEFIEGFKIKGYWLVEEIKDSMEIGNNPDYLIPTKKINPISKLKKDSYITERRET